MLSAVHEIPLARDHRRGDYSRRPGRQAFRAEGLLEAIGNARATAVDLDYALLIQLSAGTAPPAQVCFSTSSGCASG
jgi:hypothetical protein